MLFNPIILKYIYYGNNLFKYILIAILLTFSIFQLQAEEKAKSRWDKEIESYSTGTIAEKEKKKSKEEDKYKTKFISINPGFSLSHLTGEVKSDDYKAIVEGAKFLKPNIMLDIKSKDFKINDDFGFLFMLHNSSFNMDYQEVDTIPDNVSFNNYGLMNFINSNLKNKTKREDLHSGIHGRYTYAMPVIYYGSSESYSSFRFGIGLGPGIFDSRGDLYIKNRYQALIANGAYDENGIFHPDVYLSRLMLMDLNSGRLNDPILAGALALSAGNFNSNSLAIFLAGYGMNYKKLDLYTYTKLTQAKMDPVSAAALSLTPKTKENFINKHSNILMFYLETPEFYNFKGRLSFSLPSFFADRNLKYEFYIISFSVYYPIQF